MQKSRRLSALCISVMSATLLLSSTSFAHANYKGEVYQPAPCPVGLSLNDGFYLGLAGGYDSYKAKTNVGYSTPGGSTLHSSQNINATGFVGGVFGGYGRYFDSFYLAGEAFWNGTGAGGDATVTTITNTNLSITGHSSVSVDQEYGVAVLPGYKPTDSALVYVRLGYNWAQFSGKATVRGPSGNTYTASNSGTQGGFVYGIGSELAVYPQVSVRGEFSHTDFSSKSNGFGSVRPADNQYMIGVLYHFC